MYVVDECIVRLEEMQQRGFQLLLCQRLVDNVIDAGRRRRPLAVGPVIEDHRTSMMMSSEKKEGKPRAF